MFRGQTANRGYQEYRAKSQQTAEAVEGPISGSDEWIIALCPTQTVCLRESLWNARRGVSRHTG
jgi:hypothetical protein